MASNVKPDDDEVGGTYRCPNEACKATHPFIHHGYGLAGGGGIGPYMYCEKCSAVWDKHPDPEL